jgi:hypothetical protein
MGASREEGLRSALVARNEGTRGPAEAMAAVEKLRASLAGHLRRAPNMVAMLGSVCVCVCVCVRSANGAVDSWGSMDDTGRYKAQEKRGTLKGARMQRAAGGAQRGPGQEEVARAAPETFFRGTCPGSR